MQLNDAGYLDKVTISIPPRKEAMNKESKDNLYGL
jgi:hypothetical protein